MIGEFDPNEADTDKQNPYHGMLTLTIQGKGVDSQTSSTPVRGPGRPPLNDVSLDDLTEAEDPVKIQLLKKRVFLTQHLDIQSNYDCFFAFEIFSVVNRIEFNELVLSSLFKPSACISERN